MTADDEQSGGQQYDAPNQQAVRPDSSGPADEGTGGEPGNGGDEQPTAPDADRDDARGDDDSEDLDAMTKAQLHGYAAQHGVQVTADMTKDDIRQAIEEAK